MTELVATGLPLAVFGLLIAVSVLTSCVIDQLGVPVVLLFLILGILAGSEILVRQTGSLTPARRGAG